MIMLLLLMDLQPIIGHWPLVQLLVGRTPWTGISPTCTQDNTNRINARKHLPLKWASNPRCQYASDEDS
jgi:hypothetical protein